MSTKQVNNTKAPKAEVAAEPAPEPAKPKKAGKKTLIPTQSVKDWLNNLPSKAA